MNQEWCIRPRVHWGARGGYILVDFPQVSCLLHPDTRPPRRSPEVALPPTPSPIISLAMAVASAVGTSVTNCLWTQLALAARTWKNKHELCPGVSWWSGWAATPWPSTSSYCQPSPLSPQNNSLSRDKLNFPSHEDQGLRPPRFRFKDHLNSRWGFLGQDKCMNRVTIECLYLKIYWVSWEILVYSV
jgi:hypothetical protein